MTEVTRWLRAYSTEGDELVYEWQLPVTVSLANLQSLVGVAASNPMYDCFPMNDRAIEVLESRLELRQLRLPEHVRVEYFLEADQVG